MAIPEERMIRVEVGSCCASASEGRVTRSSLQKAARMRAHAWVYAGRMLGHA